MSCRSRRLYRVGVPREPRLPCLQDEVRLLCCRLLSRRCHNISSIPCSSACSVWNPDTGRRVGEDTHPAVSACRRFTVRSVLQHSLGFHPTTPHGDAVAFRSRLPPVRPRKGLASTCSPPIAQSCPANSHLLLGEKSSKCAGPPCGTPRCGVIGYLSPAAVPGGPA